MTLARYRETVVRLRPSETDDGHGNTVTVWDTPDELAVDGCLVAPGTSSEDLSRGDTITSGFTVYAPPGADITSTDRLRVRDIDYDVLGEPAAWPKGTVVVLTRTEG